VEILDERALLDESDLGEWRWIHAGPGVRPLLALQCALHDPVGGPDPEEMLLELLGEISGARTPTGGDAPSWVRRAREALDDLAPEGIPVRRLAERIGVHPVSLTRAFRRAYGVPVSVYRRRVRLQRAAACVVGTDRELGSIAVDAGYADQAHMCRDVRGVTGLSPSRLRRVARS